MTGSAGRDRLDWPTRIGFMVCAMPELIKSFAWDAFVLFYYAQVVRLNPGLIGTALIIVLVFDTAVDPYVGTVSDRIRRAPLGRRHTLMAAAILPFAIGLALVFSPPAGLSQFGIFAWLVGFGLLARVGISFWTVPAYAMGGELSRDPRERAVIAVMRNLGNQAAVLTVPAIAFGWLFVASPAFPKPQLDPAPYPGFGLFVSLLGAALMVIGILGTRARLRQIERNDTSAGPPARAASPVAIVRQIVGAVRVTPNVGRLFVVGLLVLFTTSVINQLSLHLATYFWQLDAAATRSLLMAGTLGALVAMALAPHVMCWLGTRRAMIAGLTAYFLLQAGVVLLPLIGLGPAPASAAIGGFVFAARLAGGIAYGLYVVPFNTVTYDIGDEHEANSGSPQQGFVASMMFLGLQIGSGLVGLMSGLFLHLIDFPAGSAVADVPVAKVHALAWFVITLILLAGATVSWAVSRFTVSSAKQDEIRAQLAR